MKTYRFDRQKELSQQAIELVTAHLRKHADTFLVIDVQENPVFQNQDIDLLWVQNDGEYTEISVEVKADYQISKTGNLFLETVSHHKRGKPGCFLTSQAQFWYYVDPNDRLAIVFRPAEAREWVQRKRLDCRFVGNAGSLRQSAYLSEGVLLLVSELIAAGIAWKCVL